MSSTDQGNTAPEQASGGLLGLAKSVLGLGDKEKLTEPVDMSKAETVDKTNEKGTLKDSILQKADALLEHNPEVEKTNKVNIQTDKGMEVTKKQGTKTQMKTQHKVDKTGGRKIKEAEDVDEMDEENELGDKSSSNTGGLTGKITNLVSSAAMAVESTVESIAEKTLGHDRTENLKHKATDLLESVENKLGFTERHTEEEPTTLQQVSEKVNEAKKDLKEKVGPAKARLHAVKTKVNERIEEAKGGAKKLNKSDKDEKSSTTGAEEKQKDVGRTTADGVPLDEKSNLSIIPTGSNSPRQLKVGGAASRHRKARKAKLAKMHPNEAESKESLHGGKGKAEEKSEMKSKQTA